MDKRNKKRRQRRSFSSEYKAEAVRLCKVGDSIMRAVRPIRFGGTPSPRELFCAA